MEILDFPFDREKYWLGFETTLKALVTSTDGPEIPPELYQEVYDHVREVFDIVWIERKIPIETRAISDPQVSAREAAQKTANIFYEHLENVFKQLAVRETEIVMNRWNK